MKSTERIKKMSYKYRKVLFLIVLFFASVTSVAYGYRWQNRDKPTQLGVSYSIKYAEELGLDWKQGFLALADEVQVKNFRLMSYWDQGESTRDTYNFEDLDWQIDQAERHNATVSLAVGQRQPRWPECHIPEWALELNDQEYRTELKQYVAAVVTRYKDSPAVISYQVENEAANSQFGICPKSYDAAFLTEEIELVKQIDPEADVITNVSNQSGLTLFGPVNSADKVGFSIYHNAHFDLNNKTYGWRYLTPSHWHSLRAGLIGGIHPNTEIFVHELQAEPWGPEATVNLSSEEQAKTMNPDQLRAIVNFTEQTGAKEIYLWGGEWWVWRKQQFNDRALWQTAKNIFEEANMQGFVNSSDGELTCNDPKQEFLANRCERLDNLSN